MLYVSYVFQLDDVWFYYDNCFCCWFHLFSWTKEVLFTRFWIFTKLGYIRLILLLYSWLGNNARANWVSAWRRKANLKNMKICAFKRTTKIIPIFDKKMYFWKFRFYWKSIFIHSTHSIICTDIKFVWLITLCI